MEPEFAEKLAIVRDILKYGSKTAEEILLALNRCGTKTNLSTLNTFLQQAVKLGLLISQNKNYSLPATASSTIGTKTQKPSQIPTSTSTGMMR